MTFNGDLEEQDLHALELDERQVHKAMDLHRRHLSDEQVRTVENYITEIFTAFGLDLSTSATMQTPQRFLRAMFEATEGYEGDPKLLTVFETECRGGPDCRLIWRSFMAVYNSRSMLIGPLLSATLLLH
jgi:hypothetical protein